MRTTLQTWSKLQSTLNEAQRRWSAAQKALELGRGGREQVHQLTGLSRTTIARGIKELTGGALDVKRIRRPGGGLKRAEVDDPRLRKDLQRILSETTAGDPTSHLKWTTKSCRGIAEALVDQGHAVSYHTVCRLLHDDGYSLQGDFKTLEGKQDPRRDEQFRHINRTVNRFLRRGDPVISVDAKKREQIGAFKNPGKTWCLEGCPPNVNVYDFPCLAHGLAIPYGAFDVAKNRGLVNIGVSHDTAELAVESIRRWWRLIGRAYYPKAKRLLVCADSGGSNGARNKLWKRGLQTLCDELGLSITVCHYPVGASKWNKIEHRMFSFISIHWRGQPLYTYETMINLIGGTKTKSGLKVKALLDRHEYETGITVSTKEMAALNITFDNNLPDYNYTIMPRFLRRH